MTMQNKIFNNYDIWFGKLNFSDDYALWFRYTNFFGKKNVRHVWAILFEKHKIVTAKNLIEEVFSSPESENSLFYWNHKNKLSLENVCGDTGKITWNLDFKDMGKSFLFVPSFLTKLGFLKNRYESQFQDIRFFGEVGVQGKTWQIQNQPGMIGHITGNKQAHDWVWIHCNEFSEQEDVVFEGLSARLKMGGLVCGPFSNFVLYDDGQKYVFDNLRTFLSAKTSLENDDFTFVAKKQHLTLTGKVCFDQFQPAVVEYHDTDLSKLYCRNSKRATLDLKLHHSKTNESKRFTSKGKVAYEIVDRHLPDKIDL